MIVRTIYLLFFYFQLFFCCSNQKIKNIYETDFQRNLNVFFKDASTSPLKKNDLKKFNSLPFFLFFSAFVIYAKFELTPKSTFFDMKTSTSRISKERVYGILKFEIDGNKYQLKVWMMPHAKHLWSLIPKMFQHAFELNQFHYYYI